MSGGSRLTGQVRIVGTGLLGTSIGLGLVARGVDVILDDASPANLRLAIDYGAGRASLPTDAPVLVVVCVPPDVTARVIATELAAHPTAVVTDVASVKSQPLAELVSKFTLMSARTDIDNSHNRGGDEQTTGVGANSSDDAPPALARYVGGHPLAGRERGGAVAGRADLFLGRPWVITRHDSSDDTAAAMVESLALDLGAVPVELSVEQHDSAVALISHVPQLVASLLAGRLAGAPAASVSLAGQGLRDTTRIASSEPELWVQILGSNAAPVVEVLRAYRADLDTAIEALVDPDAPGARRRIADLIAAGNTGVQSIPGKHGQDRRYSQLTVMVDDRPGELARLLTEIGEIGVNMEDLRLEHSPGAQVGIAEISVLPEAEQRLVDALETRGWRIAEAGL